MMEQLNDIVADVTILKELLTKVNIPEIFTTFREQLRRQDVILDRLTTEKKPIEKNTNVVETPKKGDTDREALLNERRVEVLQNINNNLAAEKSTLIATRQILMDEVDSKNIHIQQQTEMINKLRAENSTLGHTIDVV